MRDRGEVALHYRKNGLSAEITIPASALVDRIPVDAIRGEKPAVSNDVRSGPDLTNQACLLVEDNYVISLDTARVLGEVGFETVETAMNVSDALAKIDTLQPGVAILDINLSAGLTSEPVAKALAARGTPFIFVTGYGDTMKLDSTFSQSPVLKKPLRAEDLRRALSELEP